MKTIFWLAFEDSALSKARAAQVQALAKILDADIKLVLSSQCEASIESFPQSMVIFNESLENCLQSPSGFALKFSLYLHTDEVCAVLAPHAPHWERILSILASAHKFPYIGNMATRCLPECGRFICAGRVLEKLQIPSQCFVATLALDDVPNIDATWKIPPFTYSLKESIRRDAWFFLPEVNFEQLDSDLIPLDSARIIFAGGRGLGSKQNFDRLIQCAKKFHVGVAASRLAVDSGWCRNDLQVGQTGKSVAPDLYVTFGISGAIQHLAGIKNAQKIMAINNDKDAPIFKYAEYGIVADLNDVLDDLLTK